ncbi:MAG: patatin family protein [Clostridia bacterium]|nr:patatin family protein [Clostridia bacterium]
MKKGMILEGGAMLGMFTAGVIDVMMENGIAYDGVIGVSAGAAFGCNYKSKQIGRVIRYNTKFVRDKRYCGLRVLLKTGNIYSTEFCYDEVPLKHDKFDFDTFERNPMEFYVTCTDVESGEAVYHRYEGWQDGGFDWIRASASMPLVSQIVEVGGKRLLDGGVADAVPIRFFESIGYDRNVAVLTKPKGYRKSRDKIVPLMKARYGKYPAFVKTFEERYRVYNETMDYIDEREEKGELLVIRPPFKLPIKKVEKDPEKLKAVYEIGRQTAKERIEEIKAFLE